MLLGTPAIPPGVRRLLRLTLPFPNHLLQPRFDHRTTCTCSRPGRGLTAGITLAA